LRSLSLLFIALFFTGCTYSFRGQSAGAIKSIAIPTFENESTEFGLGETITSSLTRAFQRDGVLRITDETNADAVLRGRIISVDDQPITARADLTVEEYRFAMNCEIELIKTDTQESMWRQVYPEWAVYQYNGSLEFRTQAIEETVTKLQQDILNKIVGNW
jgi:hypothetical protein